MITKTQAGELSASWLEAAKRVTPNGASTLSKRSRAYVEGVCPTCYTKAKGCRVTDLDGHEYLDWGMGLCAVTLGYGYPLVVEAVQRAAEDGWITALPSHLETRVGERFLRQIPCAQDHGLVRWLSSGTEASEAAIRVARRYTGKSVILSSGYHGWTSQFMALQPMRDGIPSDYDRMIAGFAYNDLASVDLALKAHRGHVAAIFLEPTLFDVPAPGFLDGLRERATKHKALLVYDEVVCGWRWAVGGYQAVAGVPTPDLATFGKAIANGFPVSALVGPGRIMEKADCISGTFGGNAGALAAVEVTLMCYDAMPIVTDHLRHIGEGLIRGTREHLTTHAPDLVCEGQGPHPRLVWKNDPENRLMSTLIQEAAARGVLIHPGGLNPSLAHGGFEVAQTITVLRDALEAVLDGVPLKGLPFEPAFQRDPEPKKGRA